MRRYEGFLRRSTARPLWPARWWIVAVELGAPDTSQSESLRRSALARWSAVVLDCHGSRLARHAALEGTSAGEFWSAFLAQPVPRGGLWIMSPRALMAWQLLGLWDRIEGGAIKVAESLQRWVGRTPERGTGRSSGVLMVKDPPTALIGESHDEALKFTWVCAGNYGLQPVESGVDCRAEAARLSESVVESSRVLDTFGIGGWGVTAGCMAFRGWRSSYIGPPLYISSGRLGDSLERAAVAGGFLFARPTGPAGVTAYAVDCRSMYPYISAERSCAVDLVRRIKRAQQSEQAVYAEPLACLADCTVRTEVPYYPCRAATGATYPAGEFRTVLCGPELLRAVVNGELQRVHAANVYSLGRPLADYERRVYAAREYCESGAAASASGLIKRLGVSLIGKLHQYDETWEECIPDINYPLWGSWEHFDTDGERIEMRSRAGIVERCRGRELSAHSVPSIALWVWSWGRRMLWEWILQCGSGSVIYADTDGIVCTEAGYLRLRDLICGSTGSWGCLRLVAGPTNCVVRGAKNFSLGERVVHAGRPRAERVRGPNEESPDWFRLPWDRLNDPGWSGSWVEEGK